MSRSSHRLIATGTLIVAFLTVSLNLPAGAQAATTTATAVSAKHTGAHGTCTAHRRPVAIAPRMYDKEGGPASAAAPKTCK